MWQPLEALCAADVRTWTAGYDIRIRQGLYLAALKCLLRAHELDKGSGEVHWRALHFQRTGELTIPSRSHELCVSSDIATFWESYGESGQGIA